MYKVTNQDQVIKHMPEIIENSVDIQEVFDTSDLKPEKLLSQTIRAIHNCILWANQALTINSGSMSASELLEALVIIKKEGGKDLAFINYQIVIPLVTNWFQKKGGLLSETLKEKFNGGSMSPTSLNNIMMSYFKSSFRDLHNGSENYKDEFCQNFLSCSSNIFHDNDLKTVVTAFVVYLWNQHQSESPKLKGAELIKSWLREDIKNQIEFLEEKIKGSPKKVKNNWNKSPQEYAEYFASAKTSSNLSENAHITKPNNRAYEDFPDDIKSDLSALQFSYKAQESFTDNINQLVAEFEKSMKKYKEDSILVFLNLHFSSIQTATIRNYLDELYYLTFKNYCAIDSKSFSQTVKTYKLHQAIPTVSGKYDNSDNDKKVEAGITFGGAVTLGGVATGIAFPPLAVFIGGGILVLGGLYLLVQKWKEINRKNKQLGPTALNWLPGYYSDVNARLNIVQQNLLNQYNSVG